MCIMLTWEDTTEAINLNYSIFFVTPPHNGWQRKALVLLDTDFKGDLSSGNY